MLTFCSIALAASFDEKGNPEQGAQKKSVPKSKSNRAQQTLTGCVDEQNGNYVLLDDRMLKKLVDLEAASVGSEDFFAKHLGHKVTVKGTQASMSEGKFKVTSIEDVAPVCSPEGDATQK
jgi:hypothetical protein